MNAADAQIYTDLQGLTSLKLKAGQDAAGALDEVAQQFESLLVGQMLKSMRQASLGEGLLDNDQSLFYRDMYDQQLALHLSKQGGIGLADAIKRQLADPQETAVSPARNIADYRRQAVTAAPANPEQPAVDPAAGVKQSDPADWGHGEFVERLWPWAVEAAGKLGLAPQALLAQAALETGWGQHMIRQTDGSPSNNLFGIKSGRNWQGQSVSVSSLEYEQGSAVKRRDQFRAYDSLRDSFNDYVAFLQSNPRYQQALDATADSSVFFRQLQQAGYATDPNYAEKIDAVLQGPQMQQGLQRLKLAPPVPL